MNPVVRSLQVSAQGLGRQQRKYPALPFPAV